mgnify:CR=1 FL=1
MEGMATSKNKTTFRRLARLAVVASVFAAPLTASAFDWNAETGFFQWLLGRQGYFTPASGHTLATACAFDEVSKRASADPALKSALERALTTKAPNGMNQIQYSVPYQLVTFGNWGNEIFTNSSLEGRASHEDAGAFLSGRYHKWLESAGAKKVYMGAAEEGGGYSSTYYLHSQHIDGKTHDESFSAIEKHVKGALAASITNLRAADANNQPLPNFTGGFKGLNPKDCNERCKGIAFLGTVFHAIEDSSASCSDAVQVALKAKGLPPCLQGDGHTIVDWTAAGRPQVVTLSNDEFYQGRTDMHGNMDGLYESCDTKNFSFEKNGTSFDFNPKLLNASILGEVSKSIGTTETPEAAANRIWNELVSPRFASPSDRQPMPKPAAATTTKWGGRISEFGEWLGERAWQPTTNKVWYGLGRLVAWVDNKFGDADGWNEGVASAWGTSGGANVARNANTKAPGSPATLTAKSANGAGKLRD